MADPNSVPRFQIARRRVFFGGLALIGTSLLMPGFAQQRQPGVTQKGGGTKPTFLPEAGSKDPVAHSIAENLFWNEQLMEHALFFTMLMPGDELAAQRAEAEKFKAAFADHLARSRTINKGNLKAFNQSTTDHVRQFVDFKHRMRDEQTAGRLKSLAWPTFYDHTAREAEYFSGRLGRLSAGDVSIDSATATEFWMLAMGEHADFVAHLLDPTERDLVAKAMKASEDFHKLHGMNPPPKDKAIKGVADILDFKMAAEKGIEAGQIKSIIHPALADHVRREALKAADDLSRAG